MVQDYPEDGVTIPDPSYSLETQGVRFPSDSRDETLRTKGGEGRPGRRRSFKRTREVVWSGESRDLSGNKVSESCDTTVTGREMGGGGNHEGLPSLTQVILTQGSPTGSRLGRPVGEEGFGLHSRGPLSLLSTTGGRCKVWWEEGLEDQRVVLLYKTGVHQVRTYIRT